MTTEEREKFKKMITRLKNIALAGCSSSEFEKEIEKILDFLEE